MKEQLKLVNDLIYKLKEVGLDIEWFNTNVKDPDVEIIVGKTFDYHTMKPIYRVGLTERVRQKS